MAINKNNDNSKLVSDNNQELELIKINVEKVMKDIKDISNFAQKEVNVIHKALDNTFKKMEGSQNSSSKAYKESFDYANKLLDTLKEIQKQEEKSSEERIKSTEKEIELRRQWATEDSANQRSALQEQRDYQNTIKTAAGQASKMDFGGFISTIGNYKIGQKQKAIDDGMASAAADFAKTGNKKAYDSRMKELGAAATKLDGAASKYQAASTAVSVIVDTLKVFVNKWTDRFFNGMDEIINTYESTFQNQAVQTGISEAEYFDKQREMQNSLNQQGLQNNIAITDVMQATADFVANGVTDMTKSVALGEMQAIGKVLAPYLDMQSDTLTSLELAMPGISKSMIGISGYVADNVGQSRFVQKNLNQLVELTGPVSLAAKKDLLGTEGLAMIEDLVAGGMDMQTATQMATDIAGAVADPLKALQGDNIALASAIASGERTFTGIAKHSMQTQATIMSGTDGDLGSAAALQGSGGWGVYNYDFKNEYGRVLSNLESGAYSGATGASSSGTETYEEKLAKLADDEYTTSLEEKEILAKSLSIEAAIAQEKWPDLISAVRQIAPTLVSLLSSWLIGKGLSAIGKKLLGSGTSKAVEGVAKGASKSGLLSKAGTAIKGAFTTSGKSGLTSVLSSTGAKVLGGVGGGIMMAVDGYQGVKKADDWFAEENGGKPATTGQKVSSAVGGALGGTSSGVKGALGGAAKGALIGTMFGPIGTAVGGLVGGALGAIGGEKISKGLAKVGDGIKNAATAAGNWVKDKWGDLKEMGSVVAETAGKMWDGLKQKVPEIGNSINEAWNEFLDFLVTVPGKIVTGIKWGIDSFMTAVQNMFTGILNIPAFIGNAAIGLVNGIKNALKDFAKGIADKIGQGDRVASWFPDDLPTIPYGEMQAMPDISSYATGTSYIHTNGQLAYLHEGEAVLTKSAANVLRTNTNTNISTAYGVSDAISNGSALNREGFNLVVAAISNQTSSLISKMDQILAAINSSKYSSKFNTKLTALESGGF